MAEIYQLPENGNNNGASGIPFSIPVGFGNMGGYGGFGFGNGMNGVFDIFALAIIANMFGWNNGGWGNTSTTSAGMLNANEEITPVNDDNEV